MAVMTRHFSGNAARRTRGAASEKRAHIALSASRVLRRLWLKAAHWPHSAVPIDDLARAAGIGGDQIVDLIAGLRLPGHLLHVFRSNCGVPLAVAMLPSSELLRMADGIDGECRQLSAKSGQLRAIAARLSHEPEQRARDIHSAEGATA